MTYNYNSRRQRFLRWLGTTVRVAIIRYEYWRGEPHVCDRQQHEATMAVQLAHQPRWVTGSWTRYRWVDWIRCKWFYLTNSPGSSTSTTFWPGPYPVPRVCTYDGGIHPEDAIRMLKAGWEVAGTNKSYKRYLEPPGYKARMQWLSIAGYPSKDKPPHPEAGPEPPYTPAPFPATKLYVQHFTEDQIARFNEALAASYPTK